MPTQKIAFRRSSTIVTTLACFLLGFLLTGCGDDTDRMRKIESRKQARLQSKSRQDNLGEIYSLLPNYVTLNAGKVEQQITYHLNEWRKGRFDDAKPVAPAKLMATMDHFADDEQVVRRASEMRFQLQDVSHLRDCFLFNALNQWVNSEIRDDIVLKDWVDQQQTELGEEFGDQLRTATRLFDWTARNIALEKELGDKSAGDKEPKFSKGMVFQGAGYRQTDFETVMRGIGDAWQRAAVFSQLCNQAQIDSAILATQSTETGEITPWCVGVFIGKQVYLFEPSLGIHVPGPDQIGIATLAQARSDASVIRRLNVPGFFEYPLSKTDVQQSVAILNFLPEAYSERMKQLESGLTGDRRMNVHTDVDSLAAKLDEFPGISGVRLWDVPLQSEVYRTEILKHCERNPLFLFWYMSQWGFMDSGTGAGSELTSGRWDHLIGNFADSEDQMEVGARTKYLKQRNPEYEIADLQIDVELQEAYGIRRELGVSAEMYELQVGQLQGLMRNGKRTATFWLGLLQYDDGKTDVARNWFSDRVLDKEQLLKRWESSARYNLGRTYELLGKFDQAIEIYKTDGDLQEHGNRVRARLVAKLTPSAK